MLTLFRICGILCGFSLMCLALLWGEDFEADSGGLMAGGILIVLGSLHRVVNFETGVDKTVR